MGLPVVSAAQGGMPVVDVTATTSKLGLPVTEATNGRGVAITLVIGEPGLPVVFETIGIAPAVTYATFDAVTAVTLSGGNLVATNTGTTASEQGAKSATGKISGKYYFEMKFTAFTGATTRIMAGVGTSASTYAGMSSTGTSGAIGGVGGAIHANGAGTALDFVPAGSLPVGGVMGIAVDLDNRRGWFREAPSGLWNGSATANPATNTEGVTIPAGTMVPLCTFGGTAGTAGNITTANFGASAFIGAVPASFTSGWPA
jgi:hypothetical protein